MSMGWRLICYPRLTLPGYDVDPSGVLLIADLPALSILLHPAGLVAEGDATRMESLYRSLVQPLADVGPPSMSGKNWAKEPSI